MKKLTVQDFLNNVNKECDKRNYKLLYYKFNDDFLMKSDLHLYCFDHDIEFDIKYKNFMDGHDCPKCGVDKRTGWSKSNIKEKLLCIMINERAENPISEFRYKYPKGYDSIIRNNWLEEFELYTENLFMIKSRKYNLLVRDLSEIKSQNILEIPKNIAEILIPSGNIKLNRLLKRKLDLEIELEEVNYRIKDIKNNEY
jgi:hypothetical protein